MVYLQLYFLLCYIAFLPPQNIHCFIESKEILIIPCLRPWFLMKHSIYVFLLKKSDCIIDKFFIDTNCQTADDKLYSYGGDRMYKIPKKTFFIPVIAINYLNDFTKHKQIKTKKMKKCFLTLPLTIILFTMLTSQQCNNEAKSTSGITKATTQVKTDLNGNTIEQNAIINRLKEDNMPGSIKHLYVISTHTGQVLIYSTVKGKVTSSGKRLSPHMANFMSGDGFLFKIDENSYAETNEVLGDDGTYGSSAEYIYWWDSKGVYHQQYISASMCLHISNQPIAVKSIIMNLELNQIDTTTNK